jgi:hypothetical protein
VAILTISSAHTSLLYLTYWTNVIYTKHSSTYFYSRSITFEAKFSSFISIAMALPKEKVKNIKRKEKAYMVINS